MSTELKSERVTNGDGTSTIITRTADGALVNQVILDQEMRELERVDYADDGALSGRTVYEYASGSKPAKTTAYDANGDVIFVQRQGGPPVFYGKHQAGKPPFMCADKKGL